MKTLGWTIVDPVIKTLACNVVGMGAMAHVKDIVSYIEDIVTTRKRNNQPWNNAFGNISAPGTASMKNRRAVAKGKTPRKDNERTFSDCCWTAAVFAILIVISVLLAIKIGLLDILRPVI